MESLLAGAASRPAATVKEAYARCQDLAGTHYENFTVVSWSLPRLARDHMYAIYAFCRGVDDLGDEHRGDKLHALDLWEQDLLRCYEGTPHHPYMIALQQTIQAHDIPREPFLKLIEGQPHRPAGKTFPNLRRPRLVLPALGEPCRTSGLVRVWAP